MSAAARPAPAVRQGVDVSDLPTVVFGSRGVLWWGVIMFMIAEGMTLAAGAAAYFYLWRNFDHWPPPRTPFPALAVPTAQMALMLVSCIPLRRSARASRRLDLRGARLWLVVGSVMCLGTVALRAYCFAALNVRWDEHAYGSVLWGIMGFHTTLLVIDVLETVCLTAIAFSPGFEEKHFSDYEDNAMYWYFTVFSWLPLYAMIFWAPRVI
jgi:cytochrome c oxidase subunit III